MLYIVVNHGLKHCRLLNEFNLESSDNLSGTQMLINYAGNDFHVLACFQFEQCNNMLNCGFFWMTNKHSILADKSSFQINLFHTSHQLTTKISIGSKLDANYF